MAGIEEIHQGAVLPFEQSDLQVPHESAGSEPEIIPHQHNRLNMLAIAVPKRGDQFCVLFTPPGEQPLLELVEDQQHFTPGVRMRPLRRFASDSTSPNPRDSPHTPSASP